MTFENKTALYDLHINAGAKMVPFAGFMMPLQYPEGIMAEHLWTRKVASVFDVSHMGRFIFRSDIALSFLQYLLTNDVSMLTPGTSQYTILSDKNGFAIDDAYLYRFVEDDYLLVVNASNKEKDFSHILKQLENFQGVEIEDVTETLAMIALQGPESESILEKIMDSSTLPQPKRNSLSIVDICKTRVMIARTGYTGEPVCFELLIPVDSAPRIWNELLSAGAKPAGLGARDTLRLEAGLPLYGHEFGEDPEGKQIPIFACPLARFAVNFSDNKGDFLGRKSLKKQYDARKSYADDDYSNTKPLPKIIRQLAITSQGIARDGSKVFLDGKLIGFGCIECT